MKKEKIGNVIEKIFIILIILIYLVLFLQKKYTNYISDSNIVGKYAGYFSVVILMIIAITPIRRERKVGRWTIVFILTIISMSFVTITNPKLSSASQQNRPKNIGLKTIDKKQNVEQEYLMQNVNGKEIEQKKYDSNNPNAEYIKPVNKINLKEDPESHVWYIDNRILISAEYKLTKEKLDEIGKKFDMLLIGQIPEIAQATYELKESLSLQNLISKMTELQKEITKIEEAVQVVDIVYPTPNIIEKAQKDLAKQESIEEKKEKILKRTLNEKGEIVTDNKNFLRVLENIYTYPDFFEGKTIKLTGKTFKEKSMKENQIGIGMWQMVCCALDLSIVGYLTESQNALEDNTWYNIVGKVQKITQKGANGIDETVPIIKVEQKEKIKEPENSIVN